MAKAFLLEYTEMQLGEYTVHAERSLLGEFKRVDRYGSLNDKFSLVNCCRNGGESFECLGDYYENHLELTVVLY